MTTVTVTLSVNVDSENLSVLAKLQKFIAELNGVQIPLITLDPETGTVNKPLSKEEIAKISEQLNGQEEPKREKGLTKTGKVRKAHKELDENAKQVIRLRFANGRIAKALARGEEPRQQDLDTVAGTKTGSKIQDHKGSAKKNRHPFASAEAGIGMSENDVPEIVEVGKVIKATDKDFTKKVAQAKKNIAAGHAMETKAEAEDAENQAYIAKSLKKASKPGKK